jgi:hypothetical protein
MTIFID